MSKNLIMEEDDDLVDEADNLEKSGKKSSAKGGEDDDYSDDFDWLCKLGLKNF